MYCSKLMLKNWKCCSVRKLLPCQKPCNRIQTLTHAISCRRIHDYATDSPQCPKGRSVRIIFNEITETTTLVNWANKFIMQRAKRRITKQQLHSKATADATAKTAGQQTQGQTIKHVRQSQVLHDERLTQALVTCIKHFKNVENFLIKDNNQTTRAKSAVARVYRISTADASVLSPGGNICTASAHTPSVGSYAPPNNTLTTRTIRIPIKHAPADK